MFALLVVCTCGDDYRRWKGGEEGEERAKKAKKQGGGDKGRERARKGERARGKGGGRPAAIVIIIYNKKFI